MEEEFRALLKADPAVAAITARINWAAHPQGQPWPALVLHLVGGGDDYDLGGVTGHGSARIQVDAWGDTYSDAKRLGRAVRALLSGYSGGRFQGVFLAGLREDREGGTNGADRPFRCSQDFLVEFSNT